MRARDGAVYVGGKAVGVSVGPIESRTTLTLAIDSSSGEVALSASDMDADEPREASFIWSSCPPDLHLACCLTALGSWVRICTTDSEHSRKDKVSGATFVPILGGSSS